MITREQLAEKLGINPRWLPADNHSRKIVEWIERGRCHIEHRGHGTAPLLVFEDGGSMEVPSVRWTKTARGWCLASVGTIHSRDATTHCDVCGTVDSLLEAIADEPRLDGLQELLRDVEHMITRMKNRRDEYEDFVKNAQEILERKIRRKGVSPACSQLKELKRVLSRDAEYVKSGRTSIVQTVESVRDIAQFLEYSLKDYRDITLEIQSLCRDVQGARDWKQEDGSD